MRLLWRDRSKLGDPILYWFYIEGFYITVMIVTSRCEGPPSRICGDLSGPIAPTNA